MKKTLVMVLMLCLIGCVAACGSGGGQKAPDPTGTPGPTPAPVPEQEVAYAFNSLSQARIVQVGEAYYYLSSVDDKLYRCDLQGNGPLLVEASSVKGGLTALGAYEHNLYYLDNHKVMRYDTQRKIEEEIISETVSHPVVAGGVLYAITSANTLAQFDLSGARLQDIAPPHFEGSENYAVLGSEVFYFGASDKGEGLCAFYAYDVIEKKARVIHDAIAQPAKAFGVDQQFAYLDVMLQGEAEEARALRKVDRSTGQIVATYPTTVGSSFVVVEGRVFFLTEAGLCEMPAEGELKVLVPKPSAEMGINLVGNKLFFRDTKDKFDCLINLDGTGKILYKK